MIPGHPFLPLYFGEGDEDLWEALQRIPADSRVLMVKEALRTYFFKHKGDDIFTSAIAHSDINAQMNEQTKISYPEKELQLDKNTVENSSVFLLESLLVPTIQEKPWEHLINNVIGFEDDEEVIFALQRSRNQTLEPFFQEINQDNQDNLGLNQDETIYNAIVLEELFTPGPVQTDKESEEHLPNGLHYLLSQIIGEEDDEEVIKLLSQSAK